MEQILEVIKQGPGAVVALLLIGTLYFVLVRHTKSLDNIAESIENNTCVLIALQQQLLGHDLTVSGLNPSAGATVDERTNRAYAKYVEIQRQWEEARGMIMQRYQRQSK